MFGDLDESKEIDGSLLGDPGQTPPGKKENVKWQKPRFSRKALMKCCLVKWILSSTAPQGSGLFLQQLWQHNYVPNAAEKVTLLLGKHTSSDSIAEDQ